MKLRFPVPVLLLFCLCMAHDTFSQAKDTIRFQKITDTSKYLNVTIGDFKRVDEVYSVSGYGVRAVISHLEDSLLVLLIPDTLKGGDVRLPDSLRRKHRNEEEFNRAYYTLEYPVRLARVKEIRITDYDYGNRKRILKALSLSAFPLAFASSAIPVLGAPFIVLAAIYGVDYLIRTKSIDLEKEWRLVP